MNKNIGEVNRLREEGGNYMLDAWIPPPQQGSNKTKISLAAVTDKIGVSPKRSGRRGRRRSRGHGTRGRTARRVLDKFKPTLKVHR